MDAHSQSFSNMTTDTHSIVHPMVSIVIVYCLCGGDVMFSIHRVS